jgi:hypothetical protein
LRNVRVTACCPTTSSKRCGRHFRAITWYAIEISSGITE